MEYHLPIMGLRPEVPKILRRNSELVLPQKVYTKRQYPSLKQTLIKIAGRDGKNIFLPLSKFADVISTAEVSF